MAALKAFILVVVYFFNKQCYGIDFKPCPFMTKCDCQTYDDGNSYDVTCKDVQEFPTFSKYTGSVANIEIDGNFTSVPAYAFYSFQNVYYPNVILTNKGNVFSPMTIDENAFILYGSLQGYESIYFYGYRNMSIPKKALSKVQVSVLQFYGCDYETIKNDTFNGVQAAGINFIYSDVNVIESGAFNGLIIPPNAWVVLNFQGNGLKEVPEAVRTFPGLQFLYLQGNHLNRLDDNAFCASTNCPNLVQLNLQFNLINFTSNNALANVQNLIYLHLGNNLLTQTPTTTLQPVASSLVELHLDSNRITTISANSFYKFTALTTLTLDKNPLTEIQPGAFSGVNGLTVLNLTSLPYLKTIDLLVTFGMSSVEKLQIVECPANNVTLSDPTKLPASLQWVILSNGTDVQYLDPNIEIWLKANPINILDISNNPNFYCDSSIQWMAKYVLCSEYKQILATSTTCTNTKQSLTSYLEQFKPKC